MGSIGQGNGYNAWTSEWVNGRMHLCVCVRVYVCVLCVYVCVHCGSVLCVCVSLCAVVHVVHESVCA